MEMPTEISGLSDDEKKCLQDSLPSVLSATADRIHYAETRRAAFSVIAGVLFVGGVSVFSLSAFQADSLAIQYGGTAFSLSFILLGHTDLDNL